MSVQPSPVASVPCSTVTLISCSTPVAPDGTPKEIIESGVILKYGLSKANFNPVISDSLLFLIKKYMDVVIVMVSRSISNGKAFISSMTLVVFLSAPILKSAMGAFATVADELPVVEDVID
jgi:hypothetical protein